MVDLDNPRLGVDFRILDPDIELDIPVVYSPEPLGQFPSVGQPPSISSQPPSLNPVVSTMSVSTSHLPTE
jgi:hypothetical protein